MLIIITIPNTIYIYVIIPRSVPIFDWICSGTGIYSRRIYYLILVVDKKYALAGNVICWWPQTKPCIFSDNCRLVTESKYRIYSTSTSVRRSSLVLLCEEVPYKFRHLIWNPYSVCPWTKTWQMTLLDKGSLNLKVTLSNLVAFITLSVFNTHVWKSCTTFRNGFHKCKAFKQ